ncbi:MAG: restriction endonuclease [Fimbriimonadaceae bacterium]
MAIWLVRAGSGGEHEEYALENGVAVIGWWEDFTSIGSKEQLLQFLVAEHPDTKLKRLMNHQSQVWPFIKGIQVGEIVALPLKHRPAVAFGKVTGEYRFVEDAPLGAKNQRKVQWIKEIPRSAISQDLLYSLGAFMTVCKIWRNDAERRLMDLIEGKAGPTVTNEGAVGEENAEEPVGVDLEAFNRDQIRNWVYAKFKGHGLARLTAAVLTAQGYKTVVSPPGADGGVDVIAGTGPLGFEEPRLVVQVKSEQSAVDVKVIRELKGVMKDFNAQHGLIVAWGGFKSSVPRETANQFFEIRLWTGDDLIQSALDNYDRLPDEIRAEMPLKRIWTLVPEEGI